MVYSYQTASLVQVAVVQVSLACKLNVPRAVVAPLMCFW